MTPPGFELRSVSKSYGTCSVLSDISFTVEAGEHTAILGASGCGKSTVLRLLAGLEAPNAGTVLLDGKVVSEPNRVITPPHKRGVSMLFQDLALWPNLSVADNVLLGLSGQGLSKKIAARRTRRALRLCVIESQAGTKPGTLSGGEAQRVALARALAPDLSFLFLDEPFSNLDLVTKSVLLQDIKDFAVELQITIVLVTHDPVEATTLCERAIVLGGGSVEESGSWADLLHEPRSKILRVFRDHLKEATGHATC